MVALAAPAAIASGATAASTGASFLGTLGTAGSFLSGLGSFAGGLGGLFGGGGMSNKRASRLAIEAEERANNRQIWWSRNGLKLLREGAEAGGFHPLAALGYNPAMGGATTPVFQDGGGNDYGQALYNMGQGISRAASAFQSKEAMALEKLSAGLGLENQKLQNDRLRAEIRLMEQPGSPPLFAGNQAIPGQGNSSQVDLYRSPQAMSDAVGREAARLPTYQYVRNHDGTYSLVPSEQMKNRMEDDLITGLLWHMQNRIVAPPPP